MSLTPDELRERYSGYKLRAILAEDVLRISLGILKYEDKDIHVSDLDKVKRATKVLEEARWNLKLS